MNPKIIKSLIPIFFIFFYESYADTELKCLVCKQVVEEIVSAIEKEDPRKTVQVGSFRIEPDGSQKQSEIKYAGSQIHLHEIMDTVCEQMSDYAQARNKESGQKTLVKLSEQVDMLSTHDLIPDADLNRSLKFYCEDIVGDYEDDILKVFHKSSRLSAHEAKIRLCKKALGACKNISGNNSPSDAEHKEL